MPWPPLVVCTPNTEAGARIAPGDGAVPFAAYCPDGPRSRRAATWRIMYRDTRWFGLASTGWGKKVGGECGSSLVRMASGVKRIK